MAPRTLYVHPPAEQKHNGPPPLSLQASFATVVHPRRIMEKKDGDTSRDLGTEFLAGRNYRSYAPTTLKVTRCQFKIFRVALDTHARLRSAVKRCYSQLLWCVIYKLHIYKDVKKNTLLKNEKIIGSASRLGVSWTKTNNVVMSLYFSAISIRCLVTRLLDAPIDNSITILRDHYICDALTFISQNHILH